MTSASMGPPLQDPVAIERWLAEANPGHYRQLALYLQVLREILPQSIDRAVFQIATQIHPERYAALPPSRRRELHRMLGLQVRRTTTLLTVEQLWSLAARLQQQRQRRRLRRQRLLVQRLIDASAHEEATAAPPPFHGAEADSDRDDPAGFFGSFERGADPAMPPGSVQLGLDLPLQGDPFGWMASSWEPFSMDSDPMDPRLDGAENAQSRNRQEILDDDADGDEPGLGAPGHGDPALDEDDEDDDTEVDAEDEDDDEADDHTADDEDRDLDGDGDVDGNDFNGNHVDGNDGGNDSGNDSGNDVGDAEGDGVDSSASAGNPRRGLRATLADADLISEAPGLSLAPGSEGLLPRDPILLERWLELYQQALTRRLRHLSHAINNELMRSGLLPLLLPGSLLDAALEGRIDTLGAAPNLLRMELPMPISSHGGTLQATVVLLRCSDLELEQPRLRSLGRALQQRRQEGRRMAEHLRRLRRRLQARNAETLWLQDIRSRLSGPGPAANQP